MKTVRGILYILLFFSCSVLMTNSNAQTKNTGIKKDSTSYVHKKSATAGDSSRHRTRMRTHRRDTHSHGSSVPDSVMQKNQGIPAVKSKRDNTRVSHKNLQGVPIDTIH